MKLTSRQLALAAAVVATRSRVPAARVLARQVFELTAARASAHPGLAAPRLWRKVLHLDSSRDWLRHGEMGAALTILERLAQGR